ncbi:MAG: sulfite exporter TauE/SafE family protein [Anaerolineales bacterium]|nr:sulfite exporter TauE/SafE family protein [Anaerolineales bacterium]
MLLKISLIGLLTGTLIGTVGVGGILLTPLLIFFVGTDLHVAQATSSFSFLFTGIVGGIIYAKQKSIAWVHVFWISIGIIPSTLLGAKVNTLLSGKALTLILAALIVFSGTHALSKRVKDTNTLPPLNKAALILIGISVGFGSSLTGTGGPVLLVPILLLLQFMPLAAVGISQAIQLPIAIFATIGFILYSQIDFSLGITLGMVQSLGVILGGKIAHSLPHEKLHAVVAITLIGVGFLMVGRVIF